VAYDVEALHQFTNLNRPVDFAGRMIFNEEGHEAFNFGKHKGRLVEEVFRIEPSYYSWMMQGDFPLYTKRKLEEIYARWSAKKAAERLAKPAAQPKPVETPEAPKEVKPAEAVNTAKPGETAAPAKPNDTAGTAKPAETPAAAREHYKKPQQAKPGHHNNFVRKPFKKRDEEPAKPVNEDMLKMLADKFKKG
jgi:DNA polymerase-3 subunit epsilon